MEELRKKREPYRRNLVRLEAAVQALLAADLPNLEELRVAYRLFTNAVNPVSDLDDRIIDLLLQSDATAEEQDSELIEVEEFKKKAEVLREQVDKHLLPVPTNITDHP